MLFPFFSSHSIKRSTPRINLTGMGVIRRRRYRRQETVPNDEDSQQDALDEGEEGGEGDDDNDDDDDDDASATTTIPSGMGLPSSSTENQFDKAKAIGEEVIKKVPSKFNLSEKIVFVQKISTAISHVEK